MSNFIVKKIAVLGAGVMGAQIAAHCANAGVPVLLFDLPAHEHNKSSTALRALEQLKKLKPAPLASNDVAVHIQAANYEEHLDQLAQCDLVIEAIAERIDWKLDLYKKVAPHLGPQTIFASNTSGLSITTLSTALAQQALAVLQTRFCGVHFFNPPRYMHLVELIPTAATDPMVLDRLETFLTTTLGKGVVRAKDTPNFIANRVGIFGVLATMAEAEKFGLSIDVVDDLTGAKLGRAKSGTFRTADVVGLDTLAHVIRTMEENLADDPFFPLYRIPAVLAQLLSAGKLGQKSGAGFYKKVDKNILRFDAAHNDYVPSSAKADDLIVRMLKEKDPVKRMKTLRDATHPQAQFLWAIFRDTFHYCALHLEAIADNARDIDFAMRWGFGWQNGPFEIWQAAGWAQVAAWVQEDIDAGRALSQAPLPAWVFDSPVRDAGVHTAQGSYAPARRAYVARTDLPVYRRQLFRAPLLGENTHDGNTAGVTVFDDASVRIWHQNDEILILSFKTKLHVIDANVIAGLVRAVELAEQQYQGLVIWQTDAAQGGAFCAGADLQMILPKFLSRDIDSIEPGVHALQQAHQRIKYAGVPVVAALSGLALGGGCELSLHAAKRVAALESYIGLVEVGVGVVPAGGGLKEIAVRAAFDAKGNDLFQFLKSWCTHAAMATVSKSALDARQMGYLTPSDVVVFNPHELLYVAKSEARALFTAGYRAPLPTPIRVAGRYATANMLGQLVNMREGGFISAHDFKLAALIAEIVCGGDVEPNSLVDEQWLLDLERKAFIELLHHPKTQERMMGLIQNGKPVRN